MAFFIFTVMIKIDSELIDGIAKQAGEKDRKRLNYNFHEQSTDLLQRMLNAIEPGSYIQPHKHENPDKREVFIILKGSMAVFLFDDAGKVIDVCILDSDTGIYGVEIEAGAWHTIISLKSGSVVYEVKDGPYEPIDDKNFATWAPREGDSGIESYMQSLLDIIDR